MLGGRGLRGDNNTQYTATLGEVEGKFYGNHDGGIGIYLLIGMFRKCVGEFLEDLQADARGKDDSAV